MVFIVTSQFIVSIIGIKILTRKSIEFIGPKLNEKMPVIDLFEPKLLNKVDLSEDAVLFFFNMQCNTCKEIIQELKNNNICDSRLKFITYGSSDNIEEYKKKYNIDNLFYITENIMKTKLNIKLFPFVVKCENGVIKDKNVASFGIIQQLLEQ
jgi:hypothetical protein